MGTWIRTIEQHFEVFLVCEITSPFWMTAVEIENKMGKENNNSLKRVGKAENEENRPQEKGEHA